MKKIYKNEKQPKKIRKKRGGKKQKQKTSAKQKATIPRLYKIIHPPSK